MKRIVLACSTFLLLTSGPARADAAPDAPKLFQSQCARCHGDNRLGAMGPALLPENLHRLRKNKAAGVIANGLPATQMPAFGKKLTDTQITTLVDYIYSPPEHPPVWGEKEIRASHIVYPAAEQASPSDKPVYDADPLNLFLVVEAGDHHVTVLDGDRLEPIKRFKSRFALHGGPKFSSTGRYVYFASRDGWITKYDMYRLEVIAEIRAGINTRNAAVSADDRYVMVGNYLPHSLVLLDAKDLSLIKIIDVKDDFGHSSRVSAVYTAPPRQSFVVALKDLKEVWEISYADDPEPVYNGLMHDYQLKEGLAETGRFPVRRIRLNDYLDDFFFDPSYEHLIGAARNARNGQVVNLLVGRKIADIDLSGMPHLGSGITWKYADTRVLATPNLKDGVVTIIDMHNWKTIKKINTDGPGFFLRSHENTPYAWVDVFVGPHRDEVHVIDKKTLEIVKTLKPVPGKTSGHVEFTRDGKKALLSIWEKDGAIIVYDASTLKEIKRLPMSKPVGKYNVYNKITRSEGTSH
ncbi:mono/diheme cytochrome c family protein [Thiogranum longum]|uniref:Mono/diheme cytochrome c family protein n=1 Tax=Thiogranum longum TaxID=1537524 RepID=A0A4R1H735_9GAMM|nr:nitrite reductase [Thiogranum longum]TCK17597.1 mono/diheme cytochrome c family protein [Thiogranum longum]